MVHDDDLGFLHSPSSTNTTHWTASKAIPRMPKMHHGSLQSISLKSQEFFTS